MSQPGWHCGVDRRAAGRAALRTHDRKFVWSDPVTLWEDTSRRIAEQSGAYRFQLAQRLLRAAAAATKRCQNIGEVAQTGPPERLPVAIDWGLAYDCLNSRSRRWQKLQAGRGPEADRARLFADRHGLRQEGQNAEALEALAYRRKIDPEATT